MTQPVVTLAAPTKAVKGKASTKKDKANAAGSKRTRKQASIDALDKIAASKLADDSQTEQPSEPLQETSELAMAPNALQEHVSAADLQSAVAGGEAREDDLDLTANESLDLTTKRSKQSR